MREVKVVALLLGLFLLIWIVRKLGVKELETGFRTLGWRLLVPVALVFPCYLLYTLSWKLFLQRFDGHHIPFWNLFRIKVSGEAANTLTPLNFAGGDPVRVWLLSKTIPLSISGASVVVDRTLQIMAIVVLIFFGNMAALLKLDLPVYAKSILGGVAAFLLLFISLFTYYQTRGLFQKLSRLAKKLRLRNFSDHTLKKIEELDAHVLDFYRQDRALFLGCFLLHVSARFIGIWEIYLLAHFLGVPMDFWGALFFSAVIPITNMVGSLVPGNLGVLEGVVSSLFLALHWNPADGVVLQIARRVRSFLWIVVGLIFIAIFKAKNKEETTVSEKTPA